MLRSADPFARIMALIWIVAVCGGCQNGPFATQSSSGAPKSPGLFAEGGLFRPGGAASNVEPSSKTLISRAGDSVSGQYERLNADLTSQLADARKSATLLTDRVTMLQEELNKTAIQYRDLQLQKLDSDKRLQAVSATMRSRPGASISTNSSTRGTLRPIEIPGVEVRQEGDTIRIALPADQLFSPGTNQLLPSAALMLQDVAKSVTQAYPRQLMGIESFTDGGLGGGIASPHQLTVSQAFAVFQELTNRYRMPASQIMVVGHGANAARSSANSFADRARSRRIELVIYPETAN